MDIVSCDSVYVYEYYCHCICSCEIEMYCCVKQRCDGVGDYGVRNYDMREGCVSCSNYWQSIYTIIISIY